ncbi:MAG: hypothetical protein H7Y38_15155 [Armatimonadetes bacterium]|nr:hypothetical protein [Armatimonadota bacterium]
MPANDFWNIAFGAYSLSVNRRDRTYSLTETVSGTVWANALPLGYVELLERESGAVTRYPFGDLQTVSLSEKAGANGKRILFGLDAPGKIPVDVYLTCTEREIQLTVEASRDTRTHRVERVLLLPGLCHVPDEPASYLVIPHGEGAILTAKDAPNEPMPLAVWDAETGLTMPFVGAVRGSSTLALLTDSAYAVADLTRSETGVTLDLRYERDPERRRLDARIVLLPGGDYVAVARAYRDKVIGDGGHVSQRKKRRDRAGSFSVMVAVPPLADTANRWRVIEDFEETMREPNESPRVAALSGDWASPFLDGWQYPDAPPRFATPVPLLAVVYRDATPFRFGEAIPASARFLRAALYLAEPVVDETDSLGAFLVSHRFLHPDFDVEEARYSNGTVVTVNASATDTYDAPGLRLSPREFSVTAREPGRERV